MSSFNFEFSTSIIAESTATLPIPRLAGKFSFKTTAIRPSVAASSGLNSALTTPTVAIVAAASSKTFRIVPFFEYYCLILSSICFICKFTIICLFKKNLLIQIFIGKTLFNISTQIFRTVSLKKKPAENFASVAKRPCRQAICL